MLHCTTIAELRGTCDRARSDGGRVGLVPTMGYLHEGHRSLMRAARAASDLVVVTIFVNPLQFGANEDLDSYPRDLDRDLAACAEEGVDVVFTPTVAEMYPGGAPRTTVRVAELTEGLCGTARPTHFDGVTTVVAKLFAITGPCRAYFGRKDAQQLAVVTRMAADLDLPVEVVGCPLVREPDGLAMSSRNSYLTTDERAVATVLSRALREAVDEVRDGERDASTVRNLLDRRISTEPAARLDYAEVVDAADLPPVGRIEGRVLLAVAAFVGRARLIDNAVVTVSTSGVEADLGVLVSESEAQCAAS